MIRYNSFFSIFILVLTVLVVIGTMILFFIEKDSTIFAAGFGMILSMINFILGYYAITISYNKSVTKFLKVIIIGMGIRLSLLLFGIFVFVKLLNVQIIPFITSLFVFYIIFLIFEIVYIQKRILSKSIE